jgi:DNA-binding Lrp family transcriptional regulator
MTLTDRKILDRLERDGRVTLQVLSDELYIPKHQVKQVMARVKKHDARVRSDELGLYYEQ